MTARSPAPMMATSSTPAVAAVRAAAARARRRAVAVAIGLGAIGAVIGAIGLRRRGSAGEPPVALGLADGGVSVGADAGPAPCDSLAACGARCAAAPGDLDACVGAADRARTAVGAARDLAGARARYRALCRATGDPATCTRLALTTGLLADRAAAPDWLDPATAPAGLLTAACRADGDRGLLACAAIELLAIAVPDPAAVAARLAGCPQGAAAACAAAIARDRCERDELPEACYLAALAPTTGEWARGRLAAACRAGSDPLVCHYGWLASRADGDLLVACSDIETEPSLAPACLARARQSTARQRYYLARACALGACDELPEAGATATLERACAADQLNACARLLARPIGKAGAAARAAVLARAAALAPDVDLAAPALPPTASRPSYEACRYGAVAACDAVVAALPPSSLRADLAAYAARLRSPFTP